ncbi:glycosyltransferase family 4 protein [Synechocystis sp. PCC 7338]|uniref:glycosyltransferase family 4 protein n=1 Tax=Synechocystis sp. PCC 7338 TaxID=2732530 RepID=UPI001BB0421C|nr:glycosyltransferase family 4 protein [Synechocystis sp. PCC 7338]QUS59989.1 glycosyltransferase family 4 protein [Synechocystis sp. PCC 7338]
MTTNSNFHKFLVLQAGARMHYAVPALLAEQGLLKRFYTDLHGSHLLLKVVKQFLPSSLQPKPLKRLLGRKLPKSLSPDLVKDQFFYNLLYPLLRKINAQLISPEEEIFSLIEQEGFAGATALYTNYINSDLELVKQAKEKGLYCVHELIIGADVGRILLEERQLFPGIEPQGESLNEVETGIQRDIQKWQTVDQILVPSQYCFDSSVALGAEPAKISIVPYGINEQWLTIEAQPEPGRVLFVGQVGLRKGNHYLAEATRKLQPRLPQLHVRVVGPPLVDITNPLFAGPDYVGQVPRSLVREEFAKADVFVLPTLAEGMALVHLEAMACGIPIITTPHCGSVVRDGIEGFIVPIRDSNLLSERIEQLATDRQLRERMGQAAKERAKDYTWKRYGARLLAAIT